MHWLIWVSVIGYHALAYLDKCYWVPCTGLSGFPAAGKLDGCVPWRENRCTVFTSVSVIWHCSCIRFRNFWGLVWICARNGEFCLKLLPLHLFLISPVTGVWFMYGKLSWTMQFEVFPSHLFIELRKKKKLFDSDARYFRYAVDVFDVTDAYFNIIWAELRKWFS